MGIRRLTIVLGDQLDRDSAIFDDVDPEHDVVWMAEVEDEATHVWTHKARIALFLSAMRHFRDDLEDKGLRVHYTPLGESDHESLGAQLRADIEHLGPERLCVVEPGEYRVAQMLKRTAEDCDLELEILSDRHFYCSTEDFADWYQDRKQPRLENFYRSMRKRHDVLMDGDDPAGGSWNFDKENRKSFGRDGPEDVPATSSFTRDAVTEEVLELVGTRFESHPGRLDDFNWAVTPTQAAAALRSFIDKRLSAFGPYQDAMWTNEPFLNHSLLASALNLKLLSPKTVVDRVVEAYRSEDLPIASVEGFVRQVLGWREYVRGIYWQEMPDYIERNALEADEELPDFYWTGDTDMVCLKQTIGQTLRYGYAHHIQRLMVTGLFALLYGVDPRRLHEWYLAVYVDAVEWVELPNTLGMSQYGDGGLLASKPYAASGKYIDRMSNYCRDCRYDPGKRTGEDACPFTTLFWDFLIRHRERFADHPRTALMWNNLERVSKDEQRDIQKQAAALRKRSS